MDNKYKVIGFGFITGIFSGLLGIGGGVILIPLMVTYLGISQHTAHGTSLAVIIPTAITASLVYSSSGNIDFSSALNLAVGSILGANIGVRLMKKIPERQLKQIFATFLIIIGIRMIL